MGLTSSSAWLRRSVLSSALSVLGCATASSSPAIAPAPSAEARYTEAPAPAASGKAPQGVPRLRLEADRVLIDDQPQRIELLSDAMKARLSPGDVPSPPYHLTVTDEVNGARLRSAIQTAAVSGWPVASLELGEKAIALHTLVFEQPGVPMPSGLAWPEETLLIVVRADSVELLRAIAAPSNPPPPGRSFEDESGKRIGIVTADKAPGSVPDLLRTACEHGPACSPAALVIADDVPFSLIKGVLQALTTLRLESGPPIVQLRERRPEAPGTIQPMAGGIGPTQSGRLAPELILKTIRASSDQFQKCYEAGLARDPKLLGRIYVRFVIGRDGKVTHATTGDGTTMDARVTQCVLGHFRKLQFPLPEGGLVTVTYPLILNASE